MEGGTVFVRGLNGEEFEIAFSSETTVDGLKQDVQKAGGIEGKSIEIYLEGNLLTGTLLAECGVLDGSSLEFVSISAGPLAECAKHLAAGPFQVSIDELNALEEMVSERTKTPLVLRESMRTTGQAMMENLADEPGPFLVIAATKEGYVVGGFHTTKWFERKTDGYGYDTDPRAFIFGLQTYASGRKSIFLPIREEHQDEAIYRGNGCLVDYGSGNSYETDLQFHFTKEPPSAGANVTKYGPSGIDCDCLLGPEAKGWSQTRRVVDWLVFGPAIAAT